MGKIATTIQGTVEDGDNNMSHTYTSLVYHVVFSTKGHIKSLKKERRAELFAYLSALIKEKGGKVIIINGVDDHVHLLFELPLSVALSDVMRFVKANSSKWFKERFKVAFAWQTGFGAFSVSRSGVKKVSEYIRDQEIHHQKRDLREEFILLLDKMALISIKNIFGSDNEAYVTVSDGSVVFVGCRSHGLHRGLQIRPSSSMT